MNTIKKIDRTSKLVNELFLPNKGLYKIKDEQVSDDFEVLVKNKKEEKIYLVNQSALETSSIETLIDAQTPIEYPDVPTDPALFPTNEGSISFQLLKLLFSGNIDEGGNTYTETPIFNLAFWVAGNNIFGATVNTNIGVDIHDSEVVGAFDTNVGCTINDSTFGDEVVNCHNTTIDKADVTGKIDRLVNCKILPTGVTRSTFGGKLQWCISLLEKSSSFVGDVEGINFLSIKDCTVNCHTRAITGVTDHAYKCGFDTCIVTGDTSASVFGNFTMECKITGKTIDEASYPELFDASFHKTIYNKPNGSIWYRWFDNSNVMQFTEIV